MSRLAGPLPGVQGKPAPTRPIGLAGVWRAVVERVDPLGVSVPSLTGLSQIVPNVSAPAGAVFNPGDEVWVSALDGDRDRLVVVAGGTIATATIDRPHPATLRPGTMLFDLGLGRPLWSDGARWRDAMGVVVHDAQLRVGVSLPAAGVVT